MTTYSYLDKYLFTYFDEFIKKSLLIDHSVRGAQLNDLLGGMERDYIIVILLVML